MRRSLLNPGLLAMRPSLHRASLIGVALSVALAATAFGAAFWAAAGAMWPAIVLAWATALLLASLLGLGGTDPTRWRPESTGGRFGSTGPVWAAAAAILLLVGGGLSLALGLGAPEPGASLWGGLPPGAAALVYLVGILPALVVPAAYAWGFDETTLGPEELARLREAGRPSETEP